MTTHRSQAVVALLTTMILWGTSAVFMRTTALALAPENALALRFAVVVPLVVPGLLITGGFRIAREHWPRLILTGVGMFGSWRPPPAGLSTPLAPSRCFTLFRLRH